MTVHRHISRKTLIIAIVLVLALIFIFLSTPAAAVGDLYVYPAQGQTDQQLKQDRFDCHQWSVNETGFDPVELSEHPPRMVKVPDRAHRDATETGVIAGAIAGGIIGAADDHAGRGAAIGATDPVPSCLHH